MKKDTLGTMEELVTDQLRELTDQKLISNFDINKVETIHQSHTFWNRIMDWIKWKTFMKRVFYKPYYVQIEINSILETMWDLGRLNLSKEQYKILYDSITGIKVWEKKYPPDPYLIINTTINIRPIIPVDYVTFELVLKNSNNKQKDKR